MQRILAIDSGNSNIKWGLFADGLLVKSNRVPCERADLLNTEFAQLPEPDSIIVAHVARKSIRTKLIKLLSIWRTKIHWLRAGALQCGVRNGYMRPSQLGSDRWAALIAAWQLHHQSCLVINAGTAMTIDALSDSGEHLGGIILPSAYLMTNCLSRGTQLPHIESGEFAIFPVDTSSAIYSGAIQALVGAIDRMYNSLASRVNHANSRCIVSGGGAHAIIPHIQYPYQFIEFLVLNGLALIAGEIQDNRT